MRKRNPRGTDTKKRINCEERNVRECRLASLIIISLVLANRLLRNKKTTKVDPEERSVQDTKDRKKTHGAIRRGT